MGVGIDLKDCINRNALLYSIESADFASFKLLVDHGANINTTDGDEYFSALTYSVALAKLDPKFAKLLIENNADVNICDRHGRTPIMFAQTADKARLLIENGADLNHRDHQNGRTPLMMVFSNNEVSEELIKSGKVDLELKDYTDKTVLEIASERPNLYCAQELSRMCLKTLVNYFAGSLPETIREDIQNCALDELNENFPIKKCHFLAIIIVKKSINGSEKVRETFSELLKYFSSEDFEEKLWADVVQRLDVENILVDGQLLRLRLLKAKTTNEIDRLNRLVESMKSKRQLAIDFYELTREKL